MRAINIVIIIALTIVACKQKEVINPSVEMPTIISLTSDKNEIKIGESTDIFCEATGENLEYEWRVGLGDITPVNEDASIVTYSGYECCAGEKYISCTVSNSGGQVTEKVVITILE